MSEVYPEWQRHLQLSVPVQRLKVHRGMWAPLNQPKGCQKIAPANIVNWVSYPENRGKNQKHHQKSVDKTLNTS